MSDANSRKSWDFFISYASEDRDDAAQPLASALSARGFRVWLDQHVISVNSDFSDLIRKGLVDSHHGVVIISPYFLRKDWTLRELDTLAAIEKIDGRHRIIIVLHGLTRSEVQNETPRLMQKDPIESANGFERVCDAILDRVVRSVDRDRLNTLGQFDVAELPDFPGGGLVHCGNKACPWPDRTDVPSDLKRMGPFFTFSREGQRWCITCTSCRTPVGWVTDKEAKELVALIRVGNLWKPTNRS